MSRSGSLPTIPFPQTDADYRSVSAGAPRLSDRVSDNLHRVWGGGIGSACDRMTRSPGPRRRATDHVHDEYWEESQQHRYEDRIASELNGIKVEVGKLATRITMLMGAVAILAFLLPLIAPFIRDFLNFPR